MFVFNIMSIYTVYANGIAGVLVQYHVNICCLCTRNCWGPCLISCQYILFMYTELQGSLFNIMSIYTVSVHGIAGVRVAHIFLLFCALFLFCLSSSYALFTQC